MQRAGAAAAGEIALRYPFHVGSGAFVLAGPGNNGGDAWVVARALAAAGAAVQVHEPVAAKTPDTVAERALALPMLGGAPMGMSVGGPLPTFGHRLVIDGLLGTGATGAPRGPVEEAMALIERLRANGATVVSLDVPSGVDATTGRCAGRSVTADLTLTFGTLKRGILTARGRCGAVAVLDIGLGLYAERADGAPALVDASYVARMLPSISADAHKGTRKRVAIVGGAKGMAGAVLLAARAAARSGVGMVKLVVGTESLPVVQEAEPSALATVWPDEDETLRRDIAEWADVVAVGPGLGRTDETRRLVERILRVWQGPVVVDADALNVFAGDAGALGTLLAGRAALLTPHPAEFARLAGIDVDEVLASRFDVGCTLAERCRAVVLLKGVPTIVTAPDGTQLVTATGSPVLATAGSGDVLTGIAATLLAQIGDPLAAGAAAAWVHGRAAELAQGAAPGIGHRSTRGMTLDDVLGALPATWQLDARPTRSPVLAELPAVGFTESSAGSGVVP
jgi:ADP-dependent NAD(P)H-hydrate dehydratase / NAD(P)H-hydrate epimerase